MTMNSREAKAGIIKDTHSSDFQVFNVWMLGQTDTQHPSAFPFMVEELLKETVKVSTGRGSSPAALVFSVMMAGVERTRS